MASTSTAQACPEHRPRHRWAQLRSQSVATLYLMVAVAEAIVEMLRKERFYGHLRPREQALPDSTPVCKHRSSWQRMAPHGGWRFCSTPPPHPT